MHFANTPLPELDDRERGDVVVLTDASVEGEEIASALRSRGFVVFDVPLALLEARVASETPRVVIVDVDQPGAIEKARLLRSQPSGRRVEVLCLGDALRAAELQDVSLADNVFERPVDLNRLLDRVTFVASPSAGGFAGRGTTPPPMYAPRPSMAPAPDSIPPISEFPRAVDPLEVGSFLEEGNDASTALGLLAGAVSLSPELAQQIAAAEERVRGQLDGDSNGPPSGDGASCAVPPDLLSQLDEPLDALEDSEGTGGLAVALAQAGSSSGSHAGSHGGGTGGTFTPVPSKVGTGAGLASPEGTAAIPAAPRSSPNASSEIPPPLAPSQGGTAAEPFLPSGVMPASSAIGQRPGSPALGIRLGELLGLKVEDSRRSAEVARAMVPPPLSTAIESQTQRAEEALQPLGATPTPIGLASLGSSPLSPPVRFQEPRDIAEGRPAFGIRTVPPRDPFAALRDQAVLGSAAREPERPRPAEPQVPTDLARRDPRDGGVSPAAQSVRGHTARDTATIGAVFAEGEGLRPLARAIAARTSGCLTIVSQEATRRVVLLDGDVVTAASEVVDESLVWFLASRGDLDRDAAGRLAGKLPASGRHAGAAMIAQGFLAQDDLWPVLRAHAEFLIGRVLTCGPGSSTIEVEIPNRLKLEPGVFGGATGAEIFVETARRVLDPSRALAGLGDAHLELGPQLSLLSECALGAEEESAVRVAAGKTVAEVLSNLTPEFGSVLRALIELDVLAAAAPVRRAARAAQREPDLIDDDAIRAKTRAKLSLVQEGDYFALLGVPRTATAYDIRRAYLDLRKSFEPTRLLTPGTTDLHDDVQLILEVVEEAFDILRDHQRRERYRRAIEAGPPA